MNEPSHVSLFLQTFVWHSVSYGFVRYIFRKYVIFLMRIMCTSFIMLYIRVLFAMSKLFYFYMRKNLLNIYFQFQVFKSITIHLVDFVYSWISTQQTVFVFQCVGSYYKISTHTKRNMIIYLSLETWLHRSKLKTTF